MSVNLRNLASALVVAGCMSIGSQAYCQQYQLEFHALPSCSALNLTHSNNNSGLAVSYNNAYFQGFSFDFSSFVPSYCNQTQPAARGVLSNFKILVDTYCDPVPGVVASYWRTYELDLVANTSTRIVGASHTLDTFAVGVGENGLVLGSTQDPNNSTTFPFVWYNNSVLNLNNITSSIAGLPANFVRFVEASALSRDGNYLVVTGQVQTASSEILSRVFILQVTQSGLVASMLNGLPGKRVLYATAINDSGTVLVYLEDIASGNISVATWQSGIATPVIVPLLVGDGAIAINNNGIIGGTAFIGGQYVGALAAPTATGYQVTNVNALITGLPAGYTINAVTALNENAVPQIVASASDALGNNATVILNPL